MSSLWESEDSVRERLLQRVLIGIGAAFAICIVFWILHNAMAMLSRPRNGVGFSGAAQDRQLLQEDDSQRSAAPLRPALPGNPISQPLPVAAAPLRAAPLPAPVVRPVVPVLPRTVSLPAPTFNRSIVTNDGLSESDRYEARAALVPLCQTLAAFQEFDRKSFWHVNASRQLDPSVNADDSMASPDAVESAASGLGTMVSLYGHPGRFPVALRHDVADAAAGMRGYLQVTEEAAKYDDPAERAQLRSSAEKRLTDSNAALQRLTSTVGLNMPASQVTGYAR